MVEEYNKTGIVFIMTVHNKRTAILDWLKQNFIFLIFCFSQHAEIHASRAGR